MLSHQVQVVSLQVLRDSRGRSTRIPTSASLGLIGEPYQLISSNLHRGTVRGMHCQSELWPEWKLVFVTSGAILDQALGLSAGGEKRLVSVQRLSAASGQALLIPPGFLHGYQALEDDTTVQYLIWGAWKPSEARNVSPLSEPFLSNWPIEVTVMSDQDRNGPGL